MRVRKIVGEAVTFVERVAALVAAVVDVVISILPKGIRAVSWILYCQEAKPMLSRRGACGWERREG